MPDTALIIIDMQNDYCLPKGSRSWANVLACERALTLFRRLGLPAVHVVREYRADGCDIERFRFDGHVGGRPRVVPGTDGCAIAEPLAPDYQRGELRIVKNRFSGFMQTELDMVLRRKGVTRIVLCGTQVPNCIRATAYDGVCLDYEVTVLSDCCWASSEAVAEANYFDLRNIGVPCITLEAFAAEQGSALTRPRVASLG